MLLAEGLPEVFARHARLAEACRSAVRAWGLEIQCADPAVYSPVLTGVMTPEGVDADAVRQVVYRHFDMSLGMGLGKMKGRMFRIGHLGECNDISLMATLSGCEMGLQLAGVKLRESGTLAAMESLRASSQPRDRAPRDR
jgi:alanine-glyoxylate transaminase/serine-glyoxylate transaminase/serine-pyruvate transaminase